MNRTAELLSTIGAGILGALLAVSAIGANLLFAIPGALGVALIAAVATRPRRD